MIANAVARCEFRTFRGGKEIQEQEHYLWNVEPNVNQNSTAFLHKLVAKLLTDGECLVISTRQREGYDAWWWPTAICLTAATPASRTSTPMCRWAM